MRALALASSAPKSVPKTRLLQSNHSAKECYECFPGCCVVAQQIAGVLRNKAVSSRNDKKSSRSQILTHQLKSRLMDRCQCQIQEEKYGNSSSGLQRPSISGIPLQELYKAGLAGTHTRHWYSRRSTPIRSLMPARLKTPLVLVRSQGRQGCFRSDGRLSSPAHQGWWRMTPGRHQPWYQVLSGQCRWRWSATQSVLPQGIGQRPTDTQRSWSGHRGIVSAGVGPSVARRYGPSRS